MARTPVLAAGGIVLRQAETPLIAVVRLRKRDEWVLPKGKLDDGETPRAAAEREVLEETGHKVSVQEFLGTLVYQSGGRSKVVHYWRMKASGGPVRELMYDVRAVDWLPLEEAVARLSRGYEQAFLQTVGPIALEALANAETPRQPRAKPVAAEKRRSRRPVAAPAVTEPAPASSTEPAMPSVAEPAPASPQPMPASPQPVPDCLPIAQDESAAAANGVVEAEPAVEAMEPVVAPTFAVKPATLDAAPAETTRRNLIQKVRDWLRRAA
jgi:8-oxo-dGTP diphosphatase